MAQLTAAMSASLQPRVLQRREERRVVLRALQALDPGSRLEPRRHQAVGRDRHRRQHLVEPRREVAAEADPLDADQLGRVLEVVDDAVERALLVVDRDRVEHQAEEPVRVRRARAAGRR